MNSFVHSLFFWGGGGGFVSFWVIHLYLFSSSLFDCFFIFLQGWGVSMWTYSTQVAAAAPKQCPPASSMCCLELTTSTAQQPSPHHSSSTLQEVRLRHSCQHLIAYSIHWWFIFHFPFLRSVMGILPHCIYIYMGSSSVVVLVWGNQRSKLK